jgi:hypothetical protein
MAVIVVLTSICVAAVLFLVFFFVALCKDTGNRWVMAHLLRIDFEPQFDSPFEGTWKQYLPIGRHHRLRHRQVVCTISALPRHNNTFGGSSSSTTLNGRPVRIHRRVLY